MFAIGSLKIKSWREEGKCHKAAKSNFYNLLFTRPEYLFEQYAKNES